MYVCICSGVTEDDVRSCLADGAMTTKAVRAACGMKPGCGTCTKRLCAMVSEHRTATELVDAITGGPLPLELLPTATEPDCLPAAAALDITANTEEGSAPLTAA